MTLLLSCQSLTKSFGSRVLFKNLELSIFTGERIGMMGPNGAGKSSLLKILAGLDKPDGGVLAPKRGLKIGYVPQSCEFPEIPPTEVLVETLKNETHLADYEKEYLAETWLSKLKFTGKESSAARLSGGWKKRLSIAKELILSPELLLLDEPTNHLDIEGILWLEKFLAREAPTYLLVSHDRYFLQNATSRIIEIDTTYPQGVFAIEGSYSNFLEKKEEFLKGQLEQERSLAAKARREVDWLRRSPKARTTKSKSRIEDAHELLEDLSNVRTRNTQKKSGIDFSATERQTRKLVVAKNLGKNAGQRTLFQHLDFTLSPGTRIGLMGPNGSGKTTLLKLIAGELAPDQGTLKNAEGLQIVYFDQHRTSLPDHLTLKEALSPRGDFVDFRGQKIHVNGWCQRFLFSPDILEMPLSKLSGGERARISIAHLMLKPADILLLDEPTNDLDIPTLETLEESLLEFPGAVVLITHDRCMLDRVCDSLLALGNPEKPELFVDYEQWNAAQKAPPIEQKEKEKKTEAPSPPKQKLSYAEKQEYDNLESRIFKLEQEVKELHQALENPSLEPLKLQEICTSVSLLENQIEQLYLRWDTLSQKCR